MATRLGIDIGGTFTDFVVFDEESGLIRIDKSPTSPGNFWDGIAEGIDRLELDLAQCDMVVHGTTVGLNCFLERKGSRVGLITTRGFRDVYEIGRVNRVEMYDLFYKKPEPLIPREDRLEVGERISADGSILEPVNTADVQAAIDYFAEQKIDAIAVCLLNAYANPVHEIEIRDMVRSALPDASVTVSSELVREWREYERTSTTAINAYTSRVVEGYLETFESSLAARGYRKPLFVNQSSGGVMSVESAKGKPVRTLMSGPAGGVVAAAHMGSVLGHPNVISFDMGGTSTDVAVSWGGHPSVTAEGKVDQHPVMTPMIDVRSIGAGGGSLARFTEAGTVDVGPESAGADPGPVSYGHGGVIPAVTDANLLLGRLAPTILGGRMDLDVDRARESLESFVGEPLGLSGEQAAAGMLDIVNSKMAHAVRAITIQRGLDPKDFVLMAFGGAGPMHACALMRELDIPIGVVPIASGSFSALGMLVSDLRHDYVRSLLRRLDDTDPEEIHSLYEEMECEAEQTITNEASSSTRIAFERSLELRYVGQEYSVRVPVANQRLTSESFPALRAHFDRLHNQVYGHSSESEPTELINVRVTARGALNIPEMPRVEEGDSVPPQSAIRDAQLAWFASTGSVETPIIDHANLRAGNSIDGPALIVDVGSTTVLEPGYRCTVDPIGNLVLNLIKKGERI